MTKPKDLASKIDKALTESISLDKLEAVNPVTIREYCYRDGSPTNWKRDNITARDIQRGTIPYNCEECQDIARYSLRRSKE